MSFTAESAVTGLDWTFAPFVDAKGVTPEFSDDQIIDYWSELQKVYRANRQAVEGWNAKREALESVDKPDPDKLEALEAEFADWQRQNTTAMRTKRVELLAALCSDSPNVEQLTALNNTASRVFDAFESNIQEQLGPKGVTSATT